MTADPLVTVVIPCRNAADCLPRAVHSVLAQSHPATEIIIVDDASTDHTRAVAGTLSRHSPGIRVIELPVNGGVAGARNAGLREAAGKYVCFLDADDEYAPKFFDVAVAELENNAELAALTTGIELVNCHRDVHPVQLSTIVSSLPSNVMARRAVAELMGGFPESSVFRGPAAGEDACFRLALAKWFNVRHCPEPFLRYLVKRGSHFDYFLDRTQVQHGKLIFVEEFPGEEELRVAMQAYVDGVGRRVRARKPLFQTPPITGKQATITINNRCFTLYYPDSPAMRKTISEVFSGEYRLPEYLREEKGVIVDVGANIGCTTLLLRALYPDGPILACEPSSEAFEFLQANTASLPDIKLEECGLFDEDRISPLYRGLESSVTGSICQSSHNTHEHELVTLRRASTFLEGHDVDRVKLLKLDTEGVELPILRELGPWLERTQAIALEYHAEEDRLEIDRLLSRRFALVQGRVHFLHRGTLVYVAKEVIETRTTLNRFRVTPSMLTARSTGDATIGAP
jgi:FkbM family methyltransferase